MSEQSPKRDFAGEDLLDQIRQEFSDRLPERLEKMRSALDVLASGYDPQSVETFYLAAHSLKGTAPSFGANDLAEHAAALAKAGRRWLRDGRLEPGGVSVASDVLARLSAAVERFRAEENAGES